MLFDEDEDICAKVAFLFVSDLVLIYVGPHLVDVHAIASKRVFVNLAGSRWGA